MSDEMNGPGADPVKWCSGCDEVKPLDEFNRQRGTRDGRRSRCKACVSAWGAEWRARPEVHERLTAYSAEYRARPGHRALARARTAAWRKRRQQEEQQRMEQGNE